MPLRCYSVAYTDTLQKVIIDVDGSSIECIAGSFKGVPFFFADTEYSGGGRNVQTSSVPFSDIHINEDTGKNVDHYSFTIYILGEDAEDKKDALMKACNEKGAGKLIHPHFGVFNARCLALSLSFGAHDQEHITGTIAFIPELDADKTTRISTNLAGKVKVDSAVTIAAAKENFEKDFSIANKNRSIIDSAVLAAESAVDSVYRAREALNKADEFVRKVSKIKANMELLLLAPGDFAARLQDLISLSVEVLGIESNPKSKVYENIALMAFTITNAAYSTSAEDNQSSMQRMVRMTAAASAVSALVDCNFESTEESAEVQEDLFEAFETLLSKVEDPNDYSSLQVLQAGALKYLRDEQANLSVVIDVEFPTVSNALTLCFDIFGSLDPLEDFLARNQIKNPLFVHPATPLKVLSP